MKPRQHQPVEQTPGPSKLPTKPRWPWIVGAVAVVGFLTLAGFMLADAADDVRHDTIQHVEGIDERDVVDVDEL